MFEELSGKKWHDGQNINYKHNRTNGKINIF